MRAKCVIAVCCLPVAVAFGHPGGLDSNGGHHDRKNGGYHFHNGPPTGFLAPLPNTANLPLTAPVRTNPRTAPRTVARTTARDAVRTDYDLPVVISLHDDFYHRVGCRKVTQAVLTKKLIEVARILVPCAACKPPEIPGSDPRVLATAAEQQNRSRALSKEIASARKRFAPAQGKSELNNVPDRPAKSLEDRAAVEFHLAEQLLEKDLKTAAAKRLATIVENFPGTTGAEKSKALLDQLSAR